MGIGNVQFLDNSGAPLTNGCLYVYQAGTSTQAASFVDSTGTTQNTNPVCFGSGGRASIWVSTGAFFKYVLCLTNDGPACAAGDTLFSVDQVPGGSSAGGGGGGSPFVGIFVSSSASPATTGIVQLATADTICWRNQSGSTNLCISKDANDILSWAGSSIKLPEVPAPACTAGFEYLWADNTAHALRECGNGAAAVTIAWIGNDIGTGSTVTRLHFGSTPTPLSGTPPTTGQFLQWNGTNIVGTTPGQISEATWSAFTPSVNAGGQAETTFAAAHTLLRFTLYAVVAAAGCSTNAVVQFFDATSSTVLASLTVTNTSHFIDSGALSVAMTAGHSFSFNVSNAGSGCSPSAGNVTYTAVYK